MRNTHNSKMLPSKAQMLIWFADWVHLSLIHTMLAMEYAGQIDTPIFGVALDRIGETLEDMLDLDDRQEIWDEQRTLILPPHDMSPDQLIQLVRDYEALKANLLSEYDSQPDVVDLTIIPDDSQPDSPADSQADTDSLVNSLIRRLEADVADLPDSQSDVEPVDLPHHNSRPVSQPDSLPVSQSLPEPPHDSNKRKRLRKPCVPVPQPMHLTRPIYGQRRRRRPRTGPPLILGARNRPIDIDDVPDAVPPIPKKVYQAPNVAVLDYFRQYKPRPPPQRKRRRIVMYRDLANRGSPFRQQLPVDHNELTGISPDDAIDDATTVATTDAPVDIDTTTAEPTREFYARARRSRSPTGPVLSPPRLRDMLETESDDDPIIFAQSRDDDEDEDYTPSARSYTASSLAIESASMSSTQYRETFDDLPSHLPPLPSPIRGSIDTRVNQWKTLMVMQEIRRFHTSVSGPDEEDTVTAIIADMLTEFNEEGFNWFDVQQEFWTPDRTRHFESLTDATAVYNRLKRSLPDFFLLP